jgi:hypothetical protein
MRSFKLGIGVLLATMAICAGLLLSVAPGDAGAATVEGCTFCDLTVSDVTLSLAGSKELGHFEVKFDYTCTGAINLLPCQYSIMYQWYKAVQVGDENYDWVTIGDPTCYSNAVGCGTRSNNFSAIYGELANLPDSYLSLYKVSIDLYDGSECGGDPLFSGGVKAQLFPEP